MTDVAESAHKTCFFIYAEYLSHIQLHARRAHLNIALSRSHSLISAMAALQAGESKASTAADEQPDISPLIAMEQSSAGVSAADLAGTPTEVVQEPLAASEGSADMPGGEPGGLRLRGLS